MDLYFKAAGVLIIGVIFTVIAYFVAAEIRLAEEFRSYFRDTPNYNMEVYATEETFIVDISAFAQFVQGQQHQHIVLLYYEKSASYDAKEQGEVRINPASSQRETLVISRRELMTAAELTATPPNAVDVSGPAGYRSDIVDQFINFVKNTGTRKTTVRVRQFHLKSGELVLFCDKG